MMAPGMSTGRGDGRGHGLADGGLGSQAPQQPPGQRGQQEPDEQAVRDRSVQARAHVDERQRRHRAGPLLGQGRGYHAPRGMPDRRHRARAERIERGADPASMTRDAVPAGRAGRPPVAGQVDTDDAAGARQGRDHRVPPGRRAHGAVDQQQGGRCWLAVLRDMHVTIVKPHEPVLSSRVAGHVLCHCAVSCHLP